MARALGRGVPISFKHGAELANAIRGMGVAKAKKFLEDVMELKQPVKYRRYNDDLGHKAKVGPARYPVKTAKYFLGILKLAEANASFQGISTQDLVLIHVTVQRAAGRWHFGRSRRRKFKSSHIEMVVQECAPKVRKPAAKKGAEAKAEVKPAVEKPKAEPVKAEAAKPEVKKEVKAEAKPKVEAKPEVKKEVKPKVEIQAEVKKEVKAEVKPAPEESKSKPQPENNIPVKENKEEEAKK